MAIPERQRQVRLRRNILTEERKVYPELRPVAFTKYFKQVHPEYKEISSRTLCQDLEMADALLLQEGHAIATSDVPFPLKSKNGNGSVEKLKREALKEGLKSYISEPCSLIELCNHFETTPKAIEEILEELKAEHYNVVLTESGYELSSTLEQGAFHTIDLTKFENKPYKIGIVSDTHLNSKFERLDVLNALYDRFVEEGVTQVYHAGNYVEGEARFNKYDIWNVGIDPQIDYFVKHYPRREGITTYFIAGDDHEGWWVQREKINIGAHTQSAAEEKGRFDLKYLGYVEADVELKNGEGRSMMKIIHPGGGSAYALSYSPQKLIESFSGGDKPAILIIGHYHKAEYIYYRNVHTLQAGCTKDQDTFLRKRKIQVHIGGWVVEFQQSSDGAINRFKPEWFNFFDKDYYQRQEYYR